MTRVRIQRAGVPSGRVRVEFEIAQEVADGAPPSFIYLLSIAARIRLDDPRIPGSQAGWGGQRGLNRTKLGDGTVPAGGKLYPQVPDVSSRLKRLTNGMMLLAYGGPSIPNAPPLNMTDCPTRPRRVCAGRRIGKYL